MARRTYTPEQEAWITERYPSMPNAELAAAFQERFGVATDAGKMKSFGGNHRLRKAPGVRERAVAQSRGHDRFTAEWRAWFRSFAPRHTWRETAMRSEALFGVAMTKQTVNNWKRRLGVRSEVPNAGCFAKGHEPSNKGRTWEEQGISDESRKRMLATCFKPGNVPHNADGRPIGYERVSKDGYVEVKVAERPSRPDCNDNFRMKHHLVWEEAHGTPVPPHTMIVFADGDKRNLVPENLVAVPRAIWVTIVRCGIPYHDAESLEAAMALARLKGAIHGAQRRPRACASCGRTFEPRFARQRRCDACLGRKVT